MTRKTLTEIAMGRYFPRFNTVTAGLFLCVCAAPVLHAAPVESLLEKRQRHVVIQQWDLSCGAAALATILRFQHGDQVSERDVAVGLMGRAEYISDPSIVTRREGFSLRDLKRYVTNRGYVGQGLGGLGAGDLSALAPFIVPIRTLGYNHFIVVRGVQGNRVLFADPAWGNRTMVLDEFMDSWIDYPRLGRVGFTVSRRGETFRHNNSLAPNADEFLFLR
jgi:predicted double-glycine peptidase